MIVLDTSALIAVLRREPAYEACKAALGRGTPMLMSAGTLAEAFIVAGRRNVGLEMAELIDALGVEIVPVTSAAARRVAAAHARWGKGVHPAGLNFGDCFAYALARTSGEPLLFKGDDFIHTDITSAIA